MRSTRIFKVDFYSVEVFDGKRMDTLRDAKNVTAKNAAEAIEKVKLLVEKPYSFTDPDSKKGKKVKVSRINFDPVNVTLEAETD